MRILILSFYFPPDLSAGSFRTGALVGALRKIGRSGLLLDVVTTLPNRYKSFSANLQQEKDPAGVVVHRIPLPDHASDMLGQAKAFLPYARGAIQFARLRHYDMIFATSSRLMTAALGAAIARQHGALLYLDIRDIFADTLRDVLPKPLALPASIVFGLIERWTIRRAKKVNLVSQGFQSYFSDRYPCGRFAWYTNGIDDEFLAAAGAIDGNRAPSRPLLVVYAGNIGEGQGLHAILPDLANALQGEVRFLVIGDGGRRDLLMHRLAEEKVTNVELRSPVDRTQLLALYQSADVLFLHLNSFEAFAKVLPSKIFEYAAMGKPIWAGVAGYAASFLRTEVENSAVFKPTDTPDALRALRALRIDDQRRDEFVAKYARSTICHEFADDIIREAGFVRDSNVEI